MQSTLALSFIYLLSIIVKDRGHTKGKACTGCFPQLHTTYTQDQANKQLQKQNIHTNKNLSYSELKNKKCFNVDLKCLAEVVKISIGIEFQVKIVLTKKEYRKAFMEEVKH